MLMRQASFADSLFAPAPPRREAPSMDQHDTDQDTRMTREQLLARILEINPGTTSGFLEDFDHQALADYHERLIRLQDHRGSASRWVRRSGPAAVASSPWRHARDR